MTDDVQDLRDTVVPNSQQLNADDLLAGPITVTIQSVRRGDGDQPIALGIDGGYQPWRPCKSMRRVLIAAWGNDGRQWVGRRATLYCDPEVKWGGVKVGGIRISHLSHIDSELVLPLTVTRGKRTPYSVKPLRDEPQPAKKQANPDVAWLKAQDQDIVQQCRTSLFGDRKLTPDDMPKLRAAVEKQVPPDSGPGISGGGE